jgi:hypothetical protein
VHPAHPRVQKVNSCLKPGGDSVSEEVGGASNPSSISWIAPMTSGLEIGLSRAFRCPDGEGATP